METARIGFLLSALLMLLVVDAGADSFRLLPRPTDPCDWMKEGRTPKTRYYLHEEPVSWFDALATCEDGGGTLAFPATCQKKNELRAIIAKSRDSPTLTGELHGGFFRPDYFVTVFGSPAFNVGYQDYERGQEKPQVCGTYNHDLLLYDARCLDRRSFICEHSVTKERKVNITTAPLIVQTRPIEKYKPTRVDPPTDSEWRALVQQGRMHWYKIFEKPERWSVAKTTCEKEGGFLLILNHQFESKVLGRHLERYLRNDDYIYVGLHNGNNRFVTLTGSAVTDGWESEQPDDETCLAVQFHYMIVKKVPCWEEMKFVCEMTLMDQE